MADTNFTSGTVIASSWLNDVNNATYKGQNISGTTPINVKAAPYGAKGDGLTNDIAAFISAAADLTDNSSLYIPDGDYVFDFSTYTPASAVYPSQGIIGLSGKTNIRIYGSRGAKLRITNLNTQTKGGWSIFWLDNCSGITIEGLSLDVRGVTGLSVAVAEPDYPIVSAVGAIGTTWRDLTIRDCEITSFNPLGAENNLPGPTFIYKQIPIFAQGDSASDTVRGLRIVDNVFRSINTYKVFYLGVGGVDIRGNKFLDTAGLYPTVRALIHASRGHSVVGNYFEGLKPSDDDAPNRVISTDLPTMVNFTNASNKGGGGVTLAGNTFALTGSGGIMIGDCSGATITGNTFWDRVSMAGTFTVEDDTKSCIRLTDEATGGGSFPARDVSITGNTVSGTVLRKFVQVTHALDAVISGNSIESAAGYCIKASKMRRGIIANNTVLGVSSFAGTQEAIFISTGSTTDAEPVSVFNNTVSGSAGTAISTASYTAARLKVNNNRAVGGITAKTAGVQDQLATDFLAFSNDATRVSSGASDLDWYEEGTFTPTIIGTSTAGTGTYTTQIGHFTRIGDTVNFDITITWTAHTGTGNTEVGGLPYASRNTANKVTPASIIQSGGPVPGAGLARIGIITNNSQRVALREFNPGTAAITNTNAITATGTLYISGTYRV